MKKIWFQSLKISLQLIFLLFSLSSADAQNSTAFFQHLTNKDGLADNNTGYTYQDSKGFIWINSLEGANRYDGKNFKIIYAFNNLIEDKYGNMIGVNEKELLKYSALDNKLTTVFSISDTVLNRANEGILKIVSDYRNHYWVASRFDLFELDSSFHLLRKLSGKLFTGKDAIHNIFLDRERKNLWINKTYTLNKIDLENNKILNSRIDSSLSLYRLEINDEAFDKAGNMWVVESAKNQLWVFNKNCTLIKTIKIKLNPNEFVSNIFITETGRIWLTSIQRGLMLFDPIKNIVAENYSHNPGDFQSLSGNYITDLFEDKFQNTWISTTAGMNILPHHEIEFEQLKIDFPLKNDEKQPSISTFRKVGSQMFISHSCSGFCNYDLETGKAIFFIPGKNDSDNCVTDFVNFKNEIWFSNYRGIHRFNPATHKFSSFNDNTSYPSELNSMGTVMFFKDKEHNIWLALEGVNGIVKYDSLKNTFTRYTNQAEGKYFYPFRHFNAAAQDKYGRLWMGYNRANGLVTYDSLKKQFVFFEHNGKPVFNERINCIIADDSLLWIGTYHGLYSLNVDNFTIKNFSKKEGLASATINTLQIDKLGNLWLGTENGLSEFTPSTKVFNNFDSESGLPQGGVNELFFDIEHNKLYGSSDHILFSFGVESFKQKKTIIDPFINSFSIMGIEKSFSPDSILHLDYDDKYFSFEYSAPFYPSSAKNIYSYKLEGYDTSWINNGNRQIASFTNLKHGKYSFHLRASLDGIHWNEMQKPIYISISAPFYLKPGFIISSVLAILIICLLFIFIFYRIKVQRIKTKADFEKQISGTEMKALRAQMNPHFIFNSLNSIHSFIQQNKGEEASGYLIKFSRLMRLILENSNFEEVPLESDLEALGLYMELEAARMNHKFSFSINVDESIDIESTLIPPLILQPFVENSIWHGMLHKEDGGHIKINISKNDDMIKCIVEDNGIGREKASAMKSATQKEKHNSLGMKITNERIEIINHAKNSNAFILIKDLIDDAKKPIGTRVEVQLPFVSGF